MGAELLQLESFFMEVQTRVLIYDRSSPTVRHGIRLRNSSADCGHYAATAGARGVGVRGWMLDLNNTVPCIKITFRVPCSFGKMNN